MRRIDFEPLWWAIAELRPDPRTGEFRSDASIGNDDDIGSDFDIGVITVNSSSHARLKAQWSEAEQKNDWRPLAIPETTTPPRIVRVKKASHR